MEEVLKDTGWGLMTGGFGKEGPRRQHQRQSLRIGGVAASTFPNRAGLSTHEVVYQRPDNCVGAGRSLRMSGAPQGT